MVNFQRIQTSKEGIYWASGAFLSKNRMLLWNQVNNDKTLLLFFSLNSITDYLWGKRRWAMLICIQYHHLRKKKFQQKMHICI